MRLPRSILIALCAVGLGGCDSWPLHAALPEPVPSRDEEIAVENVSEDDALPDGEVQSVGALDGPTDLTIVGFAESCGWSEDSAWPQWPSHPVDDDGDGEIDRTEPRHSGWYVGDVDLFAVDWQGTVTGTLTWDNPPPGGENAPYQPGVEGPWESESDLDVLVFSAEGGQPAEVLREEGFSLAHPEELGAPIIVPGAQVVFAVGCHHGVGSAYSLQVALRAELR